ncbi:hypothetical protein CfE428DRAFT_1115 [Chthoniobacter flavus Ellin428]|uniref:Uncharacterized protein n=1 Tax=Chthoniobacter flavus Ellin428 TaxID=497964 RepID=B4CWS7_9BACT|nr:hypothetical protein CfE428DRAFT_1115 [Chthoniobacter flavus Ellin428]
MTAPAQRSSERGPSPSKSAVVKTKLVGLAPLAETIPRDLDADPGGSDAERAEENDEGLEFEFLFHVD